tara:strand:- start:276 stop:455 length:180 start_codon:yes stop_codon:yes gene_type:complete
MAGGLWPGNSGKNEGRPYITSIGWKKLLVLSSAHKIAGTDLKQTYSSLPNLASEILRIV